MKKGHVLFAFSFAILVTCFLSINWFSAHAQEPDYWDYRKSYLNFLTQELVAHGAMLFAASAATFRFITGLIDKTRHRVHSELGFVILSGILLGLTVYLGFRILYYGAMTQGVTTYQEPATNELSYTAYTLAVLNHTKKTATIGTLLFETLLRGPLSFHLFNILPVSIYIGIAIACLIFLTFGCHSLGIRTGAGLFGCSLLVAVIGLFGATQNLGSAHYSGQIFFFLGLCLLYFGIPVCLLKFFKNGKKGIEHLKRFPNCACETSQHAEECDTRIRPDD